jgi:hypothetical protein
MNQRGQAGGRILGLVDQGRQTDRRTGRIGGAAGFPWLAKIVEIRPEGCRLPAANGDALRAAIDCELDDVREQERRFDEITTHGARDGAALWRP